MGLRQSLDEGAREIGVAAAEELPESTEELQAEVPDETAALPVDGPWTDADGLSLDRVVAETPLDRFL